MCLLCIQPSFLGQLVQKKQLNKDAMTNHFTDEVTEMSPTPWLLPGHTHISRGILSLKFTFGILKYVGAILKINKINQTKD